MSSTNAPATQERLEELRPAADIVSIEDGVVVRLEMPGAATDTIAVRIEDDLLTITAERPAMFSEHTLLRRETANGLYRRSFRLSRDLGREGVKADYNLGVLTVTVPRAEHTIPRKIEVKVGV